MGLSGAMTCYFLSNKYLGVQKVPYRLLYGLAGYSLGLNIGSRIFGNPHYSVYYTRTEYDSLRTALSERYLSGVNIIEDEEEDTKEVKSEEV